jgi:hypothetical protein
MDENKENIETETNGIGSDSDSVSMTFPWTKTGRSDFQEVCDDLFDGNLSMGIRKACAKIVKDYKDCKMANKEFNIL